MRRLADRSLRIARYAWASPASALGLVVSLPALATGSSARVVEGVLEISGGLMGRVACRLPASTPFAAMTLGHVVLARDACSADACRRHEQAHVRQYERWGPLFLPLYAASSLWEALRGNPPYLDNHFERQARAATQEDLPATQRDRA